MLKVFCSPARYVQGRDATHELAAELIRMGLTGHVLCIAGPSARRQIEPTLIETFGAHGIPFSILDFAGQCSFPEIARCREAAEHAEAAVILGAGGGKALDTARAVANALDLPVVCCPTVAASDAPCSALSVVYSPDGIFEKCLFYRRNPDLVLVDTTIIARAPVRYLIAGMGDALATWFEADTTHRAYKANTVGGAVTLAAMGIARLCYQTLLQDGQAAIAAVREGALTPAVERIIEANTLLSGLGFESGGLAVAHAVHNGLTAAPQTHAYLHGEKVAFGTLVQLVLEDRESTEILDVMAFCRSVGLPISLQDLGIASLSPEQAREIAERAIAPGESSHNEPFELSVAAMQDALFAADAMGRDFAARHP
jgi:glycerol dehydrogenase